MSKVPHWKPLFDKLTDLLMTAAKKSEVLKNDSEFRAKYIAKKKWVEDHLDDLSEVEKDELEKAFLEWKKKVLDGEVKV